MIEPDDTLVGITYRFGLTNEQLAEANKVLYVYEKGNIYFVRAGNHIQLQKNPVDSRSGSGKTLNNSFGQTIFHTTVGGDSFDSLGYKFRSTTAQPLLYDPALTADKPIPAGTRVRLTAGELKSTAQAHERDGFPRRLECKGSRWGLHREWTHDTCTFWDSRHQTGTAG